MNFENVVLLLVLLGGLVFYARDFRIGALMHFLGLGLIFMWFYNAGYNYTPALVFFLIFLVILSLGLYSVARTTRATSII